MFVDGDGQAVEPATGANLDTPSDIRLEGPDGLSELVQSYMYNMYNFIMHTHSYNI